MKRPPAAMTKRLTVRPLVIILPCMWTFNRIITTCFDAVFSVLESWPGWLSLLVLSALTGVMALLAFKYTSNQTAIGRVRDDIKANLLALKLFKDELRVTLRSQRKLFGAALRLLLLSLQPLAVMIVPMVLLLIQMSMRYEWRPLSPGETTLLTVQLKPGTPEKLNEVRLEVPEGLKVEAGPTRAYVPSYKEYPEENAVDWRLRAVHPGRQVLTVHVNGSAVQKEIMVAQRAYKRASPLRPGAAFWDRVLYPAEQPAAAAETIQKISVSLPKGTTPVCGFDIHWVITYFVASMILALIFKPFLKVKL